MDIPSLTVRKKTLSRNNPITRKAVAKNLAHVKVELGLLVVCSWGVKNFKIKNYLGFLSQLIALFSKAVVFLKIVLKQKYSNN